MRAPFLLLLSLSLLVSLSACKSSQSTTAPTPDPSVTDAPSPGKVNQLFIEGATLLIQDRFEEATASFEGVLRLEPNNHAAHYSLARIAQKQGQPDDALPHIRTALQLEPGNYWYYRLQKNILLKQGEYADAIATQENMLLRFPDKVDDRLELADLYARNGQPEKALKQLQEIETRMGISETLYSRQYKLLKKLKREEEAVEIAKALFKINPTEPYYAQLVYQSLVEMSRSEEAVALLEEILAEDPDNGFALLSLADYYKRQNDIPRSDKYLFLAFANPEVSPEGKLDIINRLLNFADEDAGVRGRAEKLANLYQEAHPETAGGYAIRGRIALMKGEVEEASSLFRQELAQEPGDLDGWVRLIQLSQVQQDIPQMYADAEEAMSYFPNQAIILFYYGTSASRQGRIRSAKRALEKIIRVATASEDMLIQTHLELARIYQEEGEYALSDENLDAALSYDPNNALALNNYAYYLAERKERLGVAADMAARAVKLEPRQSSFLDTYGWVLYQQGNYAEAEKRIAQALKLSPNEAEILEHHGDALFKLGRADAAKDAWEKALSAGATFDLNAKLQQEN